MTNAVIPANTGMSLAELGTTLARSGFFSDTREASQAIVKVLAGREMGFGPIASMTGVYIVKGRVSISANLMAAAVRRSGRYTFVVKQLDDKVASIEFFELVNNKRESLGVSTFTADDAKRAGTQNMDKFPRNMLYARAMSNGVKWFCPDVTGGPVYTPDELGERVNEDGEIVDAMPAVVAPDVVVVEKPAPALGRFAQMAATLRATADQAEAIRTVYAELVEKLAEAGVKPYETKPASLAEAIARCRDMAATVDGIEAK